MKLLFDLYHAVVMGERMQDVLGPRLPDVGHIHVADAPGRHEPGTGAIDWPATFGRLADTATTGASGSSTSQWPRPTNRSRRSAASSAR